MPMQHLLTQTIHHSPSTQASQKMWDKCGPVLPFFPPGYDTTFQTEDKEKLNIFQHE